jgi:hypothetical protein
MFIKVFTLLLFFAVVLRTGSLAQPSPSVAADQSTVVFMNRLRTIAGPGAVDCGATLSRKANVVVALCGQRAFEEHKPFFAAYNDGDKVLGYGYGLAANTEGDVFAVNYQFLPAFPNVVPGHHVKLADDNHTRVFECVKPVRLDRTSGGVLACITPINHEESEKVAHQSPAKINICDILKDPPAWNNKLVQIQGHFSGNFEYSMLSGDGCKDAMWFGYGDGDGPPSLAAHVGGGSTPGSEDGDGKLILPVPIKVVRDANFERFERQVEAMAKADNNSYRKNSTHFVSHCVRSTFTGRIDAVSPEIHEFRTSHPPEPQSDFLGFGQMGLFEAQFVLQSVDDEAALKVCSE